jgi:sulfatase modifying factor 1
MTKYLTALLIVPFAVHLALAQGEVNETGGSNAEIPERMVLISGGRFEMGIAEEELEHLAEMGRKVPHMSELHAKWWFGDEIPRHTVEVDPFYMDAREVTNGLFGQFVQKTGYKAEGDWREYAAKKRADHPVVNVSWNDAEAYAEWTGKRLPTEAEWEYAAKGEKDVKWFPWGDSPDPTRANYRYQGESFFGGIGRLLGLRKMNTKPVGSYEPNGFGLHDMCGNVSEWCEGTHEPYPGGPQEDWIYTRHGPFRKNEKPVYGKVVRGGNWESPNPVFVRLNERHGFEPDHFSNDLGFRCAKSAR